MEEEEKNSSFVPVYGQKDETLSRDPFFTFCSAKSSPYCPIPSDLPEELNKPVLKPYRK